MRTWCDNMLPIKREILNFLATFLSFSFSPLKFSPAGPFKSSNDGEPDLFSPISSPVTPAPVPTENGAASQPIRTPARNKKPKGHRRWEGNLPVVSLCCKTSVRFTFFIAYSLCWGTGLKCFVFCWYNAFFFFLNGLTKTVLAGPPVQDFLYCLLTIYR